MKNYMKNIFIIVTISLFTLFFSACNELLLLKKRDNASDNSSDNSSGNYPDNGSNDKDNETIDNKSEFDYATYEDFFYSVKPDISAPYRVNINTSGLTARVTIYDETTNTAGKNITDCYVEFGEGGRRQWWISDNKLNIEALTNFYKNQGRYEVKVYFKTVADKEYNLTKQIDLKELPLTENYRKPFASHLYYGRSLLTTTAERNAYDIVLKAILEFDYRKTIYRSAGAATSPGISGYMMISLGGKSADVTKTELEKIIQYIYDDEPRSFVLGSSLAPKDIKFYNTNKVDNFIISINTIYTDELSNTYTEIARPYLGNDPDRAYKDDISNIEVNSIKIINKVIPSMTEAEKFKIIHDEFIRHIRYGDAFSKSGGNITGAFMQGRRGYYSVVCEGYARALQYLSMLVGIRAIYVDGYVSSTTGTTVAGGAHAWNYINIDGKWFGTDPTWDDPIGVSNEVYYKYFLRGSTFFDSEHTPFRKPQAGGGYGNAGYVIKPAPISATDYPYPGVIR